MTILTNYIIITMRKPVLLKPIKISCAYNGNIVLSVRHSVSCANLHKHLRTEFILNGIFRIMEYKISIEETLKMNYPSSLATSSLICQVHWPCLDPGGLEYFGALQSGL